MKIICAGLSKTGTKSLAKALRILQYDKVYDYPEAIYFAFSEWEDLMNGRVTDINHILDKIYSDGVEAVCDMPHCFFFEDFYRRWPDSKVILTVRDEDEWIQSYLNMVSEAEAQYPILVKIVNYISYSGRRFLKWHHNFTTMAYGSPKPIQVPWIYAYRRHNAYVKSVIPKDSLLIYNVSDGWGPLCEFLEKKVPDEKFPYENKRGEKGGIAETIVQTTGILKRIQIEIALLIVLLALLIGTFVYVIRG